MTIENPSYYESYEIRIESLILIHFYILRYII